VNVSEKTIDGLYVLIKQCFEENRWTDRMVSVLGVKFACNQSSLLIHHGVAHAYPKLSDKIGELCLERYNIPVEYGSTNEGKQEYGSVMSMIQELEDRSIAFQNMLMGVMKIAWEDNDLQVYSDLSEILSDYNFIVEQVILLNDKMHYYGEDGIMKFDHDVDKFWSLDENLF
jgi:hypothetical protein